jgi:hypothetical protein
MHVRSHPPLISDNLLIEILQQYTTERPVSKVHFWDKKNGQAYSYSSIAFF